MALEQKFLHPKLRLLGISRLRLFLGIIIGISYSIALYSFMFLSREIIRLLSIDHFYNTFLILSDAEFYFYNLFYAFIAIFMGISSMVRFWLERPRKLKDKYYRRKISIINDQQNLNWVFMLFFSRIATIIGSLSISIYQILNFYENYYYVFILVIVVLFLNTWNSHRHLFKNASLKWMFLSAIVISSSAFSLSFFNVIDVQTRDQNILKYNILYQYNMETPSSDFYRKFNDKSLIVNLHIALSKDKNPQPLIFSPNNELSNINKIALALNEKQFNVEERLRDKIVARLIIDKRVKMKTVNDVKREIVRAGLTKVSYEVSPNDGFIPSAGRSFPQKLLYYFYTYEHYIEDKKTALDNRYINVIPDINNQYLIDNQSYSAKESRQILYKIILDKQPYVLEYYINDNMTFDHYLQFQNSSIIN